MIRAACTIVSANYLPYARTLCDSFRQFHPDYKFYVLLVDRLSSEYDPSRENFELIPVETLGIPNFPAVAFQYGILELNTNVKPTFLRKIFADGVDQVIYFDPDILVCSPLDVIYDALNRAGIVLTPHCTSPNDERPYAEILLLAAGVFNLGFIAVAKTAESEKFLTWWEQRCLKLGYDERWTGLFVDQKWINFVPCYFDSVHVLKHPGCNVAYWNLHERTLTSRDGSYVVNERAPLLFFHFSGISVDGGDRISKHTDQFDLESRPELVALFGLYRQKLVESGIREVATHRYAFGHFSNGALINKLQRAAFAANLDRFGATDPFDADGPFYRWAKSRHLQSGRDSVGKYGRKAYSKSDPKVRFVNSMMRWMLRVLGADRYTVLMKYLEYASTLRNQRDILGDAGGN
jgi:hypothetical protein